MRVLVCGGCSFEDKDGLFAVLSAAHAESPIGVIIHGAARGADRMAGEWAAAAGVPVVEFPADWRRYRRGAGPVRNRQMLVEGRPDLVLAFPGKSGTENMVRQATAAGVPVRRVK